MGIYVPRWLSFSSKKKGHHGSKFSEYQNYDNQRFPSFQNITHNLQNPHYQQQQLQHNHAFQQTNPYYNQHHQAPAPQFAFSPRHQHHSQFQQQNTIVQSPQLISSPTVTSPLNQCLCHQCTSNQVGYGHHNQNNLGQVMSSTHAVISPPVASPQVPMMNLQHSLQSQTTLPVQSMVSPQHTPHHLQSQQSIRLMHDQQMVPQQCLQTPHQNGQPHPLHPQQQIVSQANDTAHQYANQIPHYIAQQSIVQCTCHSCPSHQPLPEIAPPNQQCNQSQMPQHMNESVQQQQLSQHVLNLTHMNQHMHTNHNNNAYQHQIIGAQLTHNQMNQQPCITQYGNTVKSKLCSSQDQNQDPSLLMPSSTPRMQHQEVNIQQQNQHLQCQQQYSNKDAMGVPQFHYHTIQPNQYQHQVQKMTQEQHHQRIQSMHHQVSRSPNQISVNPSGHVTESATQSFPQVDSRLHECSRYANVRSIMSESSQSSKYQEHVYCNQKPGLDLPPYDCPPSYDTFIAQKDFYNIASRNRHMTHHSESLVSQKTKDSSYENLPRFSPHVGGNNKSEPSLTT